MSFLKGAPHVALIALAYHLVSRLAYVLYVGLTLQRQERTRFLTRRYGVEQGFRRFRRRAAIVMYNDAVSFVLLCLADRGTLGVGPRGPLIALGALLVVVGLSTKLWAVAALGGGAYYWRNFFAPPERHGPSAAGPYRFLKNPMYTVGYLPTYGLALVAGSLFGFGAALFDQAAILVFYRWVEKPHFDKQARVEPGAPSLDRDARLAQNEGSPSWSHLS